MKQRILTAGILFTWLLMLAAGRILWITADHTAKVSAAQGTISLSLPRERGTIFDRNGLPLTNQTTVSLAALTATPSVATELYRTLDKTAAQQAIERLKTGKPILLEVPDDFSAEGSLTVRHAEQYSDSPTAVHLIGYLNSEGKGVCGIQAAYETLLCREGPSRIRFAANARGGALLGVDPTLDAPQVSSQGSVTLTLHREIQAAVERAVTGLLDTGAVLVLDASTSDILASVSLPVYSPENVGAALSAEGSPLLNRVFSAYNTGSVFKLCVAAAALEAGIDPLESYVCTGQINCRGQTFHCHKADGHGALTMSEALSQSCNTYFIQLAAKVGAQSIFDMACSLGMGQPTALCDGMVSSAGVLPELDELLAVPAALANFSLGQGSLLTTPVQIALMTGAIVNDGVFTPARLIQRTTGVDGQPLDHVSGEPVRVMSAKTASTLRSMMIGVIESGTGGAAQPLTGGAGGKTATAQTGLISKDGSRVTQAWFTGFFPAESPRYVVTILAEGGASGSRSAAPVFAAVANAIAALPNSSW